MAVLVWPDGIRPSAFKWSLKSYGSSFESPWNGATQTTRFPGSRWIASMTLNNLDDIESRAVEAILFQLDGKAGRIQLRDYRRATAVVKGKPLVKGGAQKGTSLITDGWTASTTVLRQGDYFTVNDELKFVIADAVSDASGNATIKFAPQLRNAPADNAPLEIAKPYGIFRLADNENGVSGKPAMVNDFTIDFVES